MPETVTLQQNNLLAHIDCPVTVLCLNTGDTLCIACYFFLYYFLLVPEVIDVTPFIYLSGSCTNILLK